MVKVWIRACMDQCLIMLKESAQAHLHSLLTLQVGRLPASDNVLCFFLYEKIVIAQMWLTEFLKVTIKEAKGRSQLRWR